jgi:hypothetical protein
MKCMRCSGRLADVTTLWGSRFVQLRGGPGWHKENQGSGVQGYGIQVWCNQQGGATLNEAKRGSTARVLPSSLTSNRCLEDC